MLKEMPMLLAENENLPATDKSDQFLAFGYLFPPAKPVELQHAAAVPPATDRWRQCTVPFKAYLEPCC